MLTKTMSLRSLDLSVSTLNNLNQISVHSYLHLFSAKAPRIAVTFVMRQLPKWPPKAACKKKGLFAKPSLHQRACSHKLNATKSCLIAKH